MLLCIYIHIIYTDIYVYNDMYVYKVSSDVHSHLFLSLEAVLVAHA